MNALLSRSRVLSNVRVANRQALLATCASLLALGHGEEIEARIFETLVAREQLASTSLGDGVALPHGRVAGADAPSACFLNLQSPVDFGAPDGHGVDLVLALIVPEHFTDQHLQLLAQAADLFSNPEVVQQLRSAKDSAELFERVEHYRLSVSTV